MLAREKERERKKLHIFCQLNYDLLNPNDPEWKCDTLHNVLCFCMERKISNPSASYCQSFFPLPAGHLKLQIRNSLLSK